MSHLGDRITALVDQKLDPASREQVLCHLVDCAECRAEADRERAVRRALAFLGNSTDQEPPAALQARLFALAEMEEMEQVWPRQRHSPWPPVRMARPRSKSRFFLAGSLSLSAATAAMAFVVGGQPSGPALAPPVKTYTLEHAAVGGSVPLTDHGAGTVTTLTQPPRP